ncbi:MAG: type VI immunity family protein [Pseudomonadota bacterium]
MNDDPITPQYADDATAERFAALWDWMAQFRVRYPSDEGTVTGALSTQLNLYVRDSQTDAVTERIANAAELYLARHGSDLNSVYALDTRGEGYDFVALEAGDSPDPLTLMQRDPAERRLTYTDSASEEAGGEFEFSFKAADEVIYGGCGLLQISIPPRAWGSPEDSLGVFWQKLCEIVQPVHGSGGYGLTIAANSTLAYQHAKNDGVYRKHVEAWPAVEANAREYDPGNPRLMPDEGYREWIRTTGWTTVLGDYMLQKLGGVDAVAAQAEEDPYVSATPYEGGLILEVGAWPILGDANSGPIPSGYGHVARLTQPVRNTLTQPAMLGSWGWNTYEDRDSAWKDWRERFDEL